MNTTGVAKMLETSPHSLDSSDHGAKKNYMTRAHVEMFGYRTNYA